MEIFPGIQGGPLMHVIAAKAVAFREAMSPKFRAYQKQVVKNSRQLCGSLAKKGFRIVSQGTDTHLSLVDLTEKRITGSDASAVLEEAGITVNKNLIPFDHKSASVTSGIRLGSAAVTTRGMKEIHMRKTAQFISDAIDYSDSPDELKKIRKEVLNLTKKFPLYPELLK
jgi:glycine hydroxymethyltransferase